VIDSRAGKVRIHVDLFAFTLLTLSVGWLVMGASAAWHLDLWMQLFIILVVALIWTLMSYIVLNEVRRVGLKMAKKTVVTQASSADTDRP
jgi:hypothetical protein